MTPYLNGSDEGSEQVVLMRNKKINIKYSPISGALVEEKLQISCNFDANSK